MPELITTDLVVLDATFGDTKDDVIRALAQRVADAGRSTDPSGLADDAFEREGKSATGMPGGLAIPHCRSAHVTESTLVFARLAPPVDFGAEDGPADLVFMIAAPASGDQEHMRLLTKLARALVRSEFTDALRAAQSPTEIVTLVSGVVTPEEAPAAAPAAPDATPTPAAGNTPAAEEAAPAGGEPITIVAVTACPTGIAHTYMAAEALAAAGAKAGVNVVVEPQGSVGAETVDPAVIASAKAAIFATDVGVRNKERFGGLPEITSSVKDGIHHADQLVARALAAIDDPDAPRVVGGGFADTATVRPQLAGGLGTKLRTALLTGVSYMIPFVAAGGLLIALGFLFGGYEIADGYGDSGGNLADYILSTFKLTDLPPADLSAHALFNSSFFLYIGVVMFKIGGLAFGFLVPALAGYIAFAIADRPGIAPGFIAGAVAVFSGAGFIGGIFAGLLAGVVALWIARLSVPTWLRGLMPVVVIPLFTSLLVGMVMYLLLARPLAWLQEQLTDGLNSMSGSSAVLLGMVLGLMMCFDLGGPVNKAAYFFGLAALAEGTTAGYQIMAAVMIAGMVPPLGMALATTLRPKLFTEPELENGRAAWLLGLSFISEGAIPFAAADPLRVLPATMAGGAVAGGLSELFHVGLHAPHGGIFVLFAVDNKFWFVVALAAGTVVTALVCVALKAMRGEDFAAEAVDAEFAAASHA